MMNLKEKLLGGWLGEKVLIAGKVLEVQAQGDRYRCLSIEAAGLRERPPAPGDKIQVFLPGAGTRTYSPFAVQAVAGTFKLLAYLHGRGPGSAWAQQVKAGEALRFTRPQTSLPFLTMAGPVALFGDETSLAVATTLREALGPRAGLVIEVASLEASRAATAGLGLPGDALVERIGDACTGLAVRLAAVAGPEGTVVFTGCAQRIQAVRAELRKLSGRWSQKSKPYWSEGKAGLD